MDLLTSEEMALWHAWKRASDVLTDAIMEDVTGGSGLSGPDFAVATRLLELGGGTLRQNELAASIEWHRSRLSHQLTRMEQRGLVTRSALVNGVTISITDAGAAAVAVARPLHADAVRRHLIAKTPPEFRAQFQDVLDALAESARTANAAEAS